ncbi:MAG: TraB/VirB10 family protein [Dechloromonas sp.]|nr:TraB/VirB10 family protein [Dechloromonas sp.]
MAVKPKMSPVRRKQMMLLAGLIGAVVIIAVTISALSAPKAPPPNPTANQTTKSAFSAPGETIDSSSIWRAQEGTRVTALQQQMSQLHSKLEVMEKVAADEREERERLEREKKNAPVAPPAEPALARPVVPPAVPVALEVGVAGPPPLPGMQGQVPGQEFPERPRGIVRVSFDKPGATVTGSAMAAGANGEQSGMPNAENYLPPGSFMRGVLLSGVDAPTGGQAQQNPHPLVIEVLDLASLPNNVLADYKNCRMTANAVGDLSSERAYIRLDRLSCISEDGRAIDISVKGYIADATGKAGVRGRLVTKQGQVLANALLAGVASGIGQAFQQSATTVSTSALGSTQTVTPGKEAQAGLGQGVNSAMQQLSRYYIQLAEKLFPIIEVDAGLPVDIVITQGVAVAQPR